MKNKSILIIILLFFIYQYAESSVVISKKIGVVKILYNGKKTAELPGKIDNKSVLMLESDKSGFVEFDLNGVSCKLVSNSKVKIRTRSKGYDINLLSGSIAIKNTEHNHLVLEKVQKGVQVNLVSGSIKIMSKDDFRFFDSSGIKLVCNPLTYNLLGTISYISGRILSITDNDGMDTLSFIPEEDTGSNIDDSVSEEPKKENLIALDYFDEIYINSIKIKSGMNSVIKTTESAAGIIFIKGKLDSDITDKIDDIIIWLNGKKYTLKAVKQFEKYIRCEVNVTYEVMFGVTATGKIYKSNKYKNMRFALRIEQEPEVLSRKTNDIESDSVEVIVNYETEIITSDIIWPPLNSDFLQGPVVVFKDTEMSDTSSYEITLNSGNEIKIFKECFLNDKKLVSDKNYTFELSDIEQDRIKFTGTLVDFSNEKNITKIIVWLNGKKIEIFSTKQFEKYLPYELSVGYEIALGAEINGVIYKSDSIKNIRFIVNESALISTESEPNVSQTTGEIVYNYDTEIVLGEAVWPPLNAEALQGPIVVLPDTEQILPVTDETEILDTSPKTISLFKKCFLNKKKLESNNRYVFYHDDLENGQMIFNASIKEPEETGQINKILIWLNGKKNEIFYKKQIIYDIDYEMNTEYEVVFGAEIDGRSLKSKSFKDIRFIVNEGSNQEIGDENTTGSVASEKIEVVYDTETVVSDAVWPPANQAPVDGHIIIATVADTEYQTVEQTADTETEPNEQAVNEETEVEPEFKVNYVVVNGYQWSRGRTIELTENDVADGYITITGYSTIKGNIRRVIAEVDRNEMTVSGIKEFTFKFQPENNKLYSISFYANDNKDDKITDQSSVKVYVKYVYNEPEVQEEHIEYRVDTSYVYSEATWPPANQGAIQGQLIEQETVEEDTSAEIVSDTSAQSEPTETADTSAIPVEDTATTEAPMAEQDNVDTKAITATELDVPEEDTVAEIEIETPIDLQFNNVKIANKSVSDMTGQVTFVKSDLGDNNKLNIEGYIGPPNGVEKVTVKIDNVTYPADVSDYNSSMKKFSYDFVPVEEKNFKIEIIAENNTNDDYDYQDLNFITGFIYYPQTDEDKINELLDNLIESILTRNKTSYLDCISDDFYGSNEGYENYNNLKSTVDNYFSKQSTSSCKFDNRNITVEGTTASVTADYERIVYVSGFSRQKKIKTSVVFKLTNDDGWKITSETKNSFFVRLYPGFPSLPGQ